MVVVKVVVAPFSSGQHRIGSLFELSNRVLGYGWIAPTPRNAQGILSPPLPPSPPPPPPPSPRHHHLYSTICTLIGIPCDFFLSSSNSAKYGISNASATLCRTVSPAESTAPASTPGSTPARIICSNTAGRGRVDGRAGECEEEVRGTGGGRGWIHLRVEHTMVFNSLASVQKHI